MEQNAIDLLKRISLKVDALTDTKISKVTYAPQKKQWLAKIHQDKPYWEDISWRVQEPNDKGETEVHLGFYSAEPTVGFNEILNKVEALSKDNVNHIIKNENGIRLVWKVNLNENPALNQLFEKISSILPEFIALALKTVCEFSALKSEIIKKQGKAKILTEEIKVNKTQSKEDLLKIKEEELFTVSFEII